LPLDLIITDTVYILPENGRSQYIICTFMINFLQEE